MAGIRRFDRVPSLRGPQRRSSPSEVKHRYPGNGGELPLPLRERVGVRGSGLSMDRNPSPGSHLSMRSDLSHKGRGNALSRVRRFNFASHPAAVTIAIRPSGGRDGDGYRFDLGQARTEIFLRMGLDNRTTEQPVGQISTIARMRTNAVIPGWCVSTDLRCAIAHRGISRFRVRCFASPRNDDLWIASLRSIRPTLALSPPFARSEATKHPHLPAAR